MNRYFHSSYADNVVLIGIIMFAPIYFTMLWWLTGLELFWWDAGWYRSIAEHGYQFSGDVYEENNTAFLPGYPLIIYLYSLVPGVDLKASQFLASISSYIFGAVFYYKYLVDRVGASSLIFILFVSLSPYSIYFFNGYSETLFFGLSGAFFYAYSKKRFYLCALTLSFALITRPHAFVLAILYALLIFFFYYKESAREPVAQNKRLFFTLIKSIRYLPLIMLFPSLFTIYLYYAYGDTALYFNSLSAWQGQHNTNIFQLAYYYLINMSLKSVNVNGGDISYLEPVQFASIYIPIQLLALFFSILIGYRSRIKELIFFVFMISIFSLLTVSFLNLGRHFVMVFSVPILMMLLFYNHSCRRQSRSAGLGYLYELAIASFLGLSGAIILTFCLWQFTVFSILQLNNVWVS